MSQFIGYTILSPRSAFHLGLLSSPFLILIVFPTFFLRLRTLTSTRNSSLRSDRDLTFTDVIKLKQKGINLPLLRIPTNAEVQNFYEERLYRKLPNHILNIGMGNFNEQIRHGRMSDYDRLHGLGESNELEERPDIRNRKTTCYN